MSGECNNRDNWKNRPPFSADHEEKAAFFRQEMERLTEYHRRSCPAYDDICHGLGYETGAENGKAPAPFLPVALFKDLELRSVPEDEVIRQVTSSGTTGQQVSRIYLDADTAELQRWALASITGDFIGGKRLPMLIIDSPDVLRDRSKFTARGAGILGFSMMSSKRFYALDENMDLDWDGIEAFREAAGDGPSFAFGFTFMIWQYLHEALMKAGRTLDLKGCYLIHGGGWKKLQDRAVSDAQFQAGLRESCGFGQISDYYGMAEQTGSIFMQCQKGHLHASVFSDIEILDPEDFSRCETGKWGLIALRSWLPGSYPGHQLLTEDWGRILGEDDCPCGRKGRYFEVGGRIRKAEIRGCSDTFSGSHEEEKKKDAKLQVLAGKWLPAASANECAAAGIEDRTQAEDRPFAPLVMSLLKELSLKFMKEDAYRRYPEIYALGFWLRPAHLKQLQKRQEGIWRRQTAAAGSARQGRGLVLHIAPSNMPAMFAYSWAAALLAGNPSVVRLSGKDAEVSDMILQGIREALEQPAYEPLRQRNAFVRFPRGHKALEELSELCSARIIWGGDATVASITATAKADKAIDIAFPDKYSIAVMDEAAMTSMSDEQLRLQAHLFCRDTYSADQNACSSPRSVFWIRQGADRRADEGSGKICGTACTYMWTETKQRWWDFVAAEAARYPLAPWMATEKYRLLCRNYTKKMRQEPVRTWTNRLYVIGCGSAAGRAADQTEDAGEQLLPEAKLGMFYEFDLKEIGELYPLLQTKIQTVVCVGTDPDAFLRSVRNAGCSGVDRAVCPGEALQFDTIWDRKDLIDLLSERI